MEPTVTQTETKHGRTLHIHGLRLRLRFFPLLPLQRHERQQLGDHLQYQVLLPAREPPPAAVEEARAAELVVEELEGAPPDQRVLVLDQLLCGRVGRSSGRWMC